MESPGNEKENRRSLRCSLNAVNDDAEVTCSGSVFQMRALAAGKVPEPMEVSRTAGTIWSSEVVSASTIKPKSTLLLLGSTRKDDKESKTTHTTDIN